MAKFPENCLYHFTVKVRPGQGCKMPDNLRGALVDCFVAHAEHLGALKVAVEKLVEQGYIFDDLMNGKIDQLDPLNWDEYVSLTWPELPDYFPPQIGMMRFIQAGGVFFGPFIGWESELEPNSVSNGGK